MGLEETHQITQSEYRTEPDKSKIDKLIKLYNRFYLPKRKKYNSRGDIFWAKQTDKNRQKTNWEKSTELKKDCDSRDLSTEILRSKFITSIINRKHGKAVERKRFRRADSSRSRTTKYIRQTTEKQIDALILEALISNREKNQGNTHPQNNIYGEIQNKTEKRQKQRKFEYCNSPNRKAINECSTRESTCRNKL